MTGLWITIALLALAVILLAASLLLKERRRHQAGLRWRRQQRGLAYAWTRLFGRSNVKRLTHRPPDEPPA